MVCTRRVKPILLLHRYIAWHCLFVKLHCKYNIVQNIQKEIHQHSNNIFYCGELCIIYERVKYYHYFLGEILNCVIRWVGRQLRRANRGARDVSQ